MTLLGDAVMKRLDDLSFQTGAALNCRIEGWRHAASSHLRS